MRKSDQYFLTDYILVQFIEINNETSSLLRWCVENKGKLFIMYFSENNLLSFLLIFLNYLN